MSIELPPSNPAELAIPTAEEISTSRPESTRMTLGSLEEVALLTNLIGPWAVRSSEWFVNRITRDGISIGMQEINDDSLFAGHFRGYTLVENFKDDEELRSLCLAFDKGRFIDEDEGERLGNGCLLYVPVLRVTAMAKLN